MPLALYTFGLFQKPADDPANSGFHALNDPILVMVHAASGLIARSGYEGDDGPAPWGPQVYPRFYHERGDGWSPATLSLWTDLEAVFSFTYFGLHATALQRGREWFEKPSWPPLVLWWHQDLGFPTWSDGVQRHEHLHDHGPTAFAFNFKTPFDVNGGGIKIDRQRIKTQINRQTQDTV
ncbi:MAG: DUF3291 domain-containing protein [Paracoccaceae bacterium]